MIFLAYLLTRLSEPSTYAGVAAIAAGAHAALTGHAGGIATVLGGVAAVLMPEGASAPVTATKTQP